MGNITDFPAEGDLLPDQRVQLSKVDFALGQFYCLHTAANVHAYHTGNDFVLDGHGGADGTAFSSVHIRHDTDFTARKLGSVTHRLNLLPSRSFQLIGITDGCIVLPLNGYHGFSPFLRDFVYFMISIDWISVSLSPVHSPGLGQL